MSSSRSAKSSQHSCEGGLAASRGAEIALSDPGAEGLVGSGSPDKKRKIGVEVVRLGTRGAAHRLWAGVRPRLLWATFVWVGTVSGHCEERMHSDPPSHLHSVNPSQRHPVTATMRCSLCSPP